MPRKAAVQVDNKFIRGLITEATALSFPEDACTEASNCIFDETGRITRRLGIDYEDAYVAVNTDFNSTDVWTEFIWETSRGESLKTFVVQQHGSTIKIYDISDSTAVGANFDSALSFSLYDYTPDIVFFEPGLYECQYAQGNNQLSIVNKGTDPIVVTYDELTDTLTKTAVTLRFRDFEGADDGLSLNNRPTETVASLKTNNPEHYYNLLNQGWHTADALTQWDAARTDMPSNADKVSYFRASETDAFDVARVTANSDVLSTPATKGHFILEVGNINRTQAMVTDGFTGASLTGDSVLIPQATGSAIGNATLLANAFNSSTAELDTTAAQRASVDSTTVATFMYVGKDYSASPKQIGFATAYATHASGGIPYTLWSLAAGSVNVVLYAKNSSAPINPTDGTMLGSTIVSSAKENVSVASDDITTAWDYVWLTFYPTSGTTTVYTTEVEFYSPGTQISYHRPQVNAFYAGRAWYTGIEDGSLNNNIYFSRVILGDEDYGKCYQANDPTSEFDSDLLPDDGGVIRIIEAGRIVRLFPYQNSLLVMASNGIWRITGGQGQGQGFQANDFSIRKIASIGIDSPYSIVDVRGTPIWWAEDGIYTIKYEANFDAVTALSLTETTIKSFILDIPRGNRKYVKGVHNVFEDVVYWLFNDTDVLDISQRYTYNNVLCMNVKSGAFYPWTVTGTPQIRGLVYARDAQRELNPVLKFNTTVDLSSTNTNIYWSEFRNANYIDWDTNNDNLNYSSYFVTGYKIHGETQRFGQTNYVFVFLETETNSSCFMRGLFEYTNSGNSGRWSRSQQVYNSALTYRDINFRRLKVRGKGRAIQLKFTSEQGKPFNIVGWSIKETQNADV